ncbi:RNA 2',3'-cyclic phosphodiesterase [Paenibacillus barcinonensis]|uniref:RNA 2',3'-cyclic phosphodiesterase n=1 Tax=Paenibacillus barcinonensis TaxID=198119 RepID=A0A2V4V7I6_PAEBA|nr:RNA 2',3'-cyclic phosphodiesterase [Paenibacillus barcinonensis]PYE48466.1 2'-5' RNA ligase [Paenibacillus barcinonensis]QKS58824.1 RNA 2',3'-cyclic phosphodiesterase [Paenibacillus barcinonensis]
MNTQVLQEHASRRERLFIAVRLPEDIQQFLQMQVQPIRNKLDFRKWTDHRDYHITLQFLGDTLMSDVGHLRAALRTVAAEFNAFALRLDTWGTFGLEHSPKVLWRGVSGEVERLHHLQEAIVQATKELGFEAELRPYRPHVTVARKYVGHLPEMDNNGLSGVVTEPVSYGDSWTVEGFVLYVTRLAQSPMYETLDTFSFS